jgi:hypothetical protein
MAGSYKMLDLTGHLPETGLTAVIIVLFLSSLLFCIPKSSTPFVNNKKLFELGYAHAKNRFLLDAKNLIDTGLKQVICILNVRANLVAHILSPTRPVSFGFHRQRRQNRPRPEICQ